MHADSSVRHGGLGIGLALAQKLIDLHGGSIEGSKAHSAALLGPET
jgi:nitrogen-specific signal transduction histidine kinase